MVAEVELPEPVPPKGSKKYRDSTGSILGYILG